MWLIWRYTSENLAHKKNSFSDFSASLPKNIRNVTLEIRFPETFGLVKSLHTMYVAGRCNGDTNMAETNARPFSRERVDFFLFTAARQLHALLVMTVSGILGFFLFAYMLPSSFAHGNKSILSSLEIFLWFNLERLNLVPKDLSGSWIKLCGKILYLLPCCHCSRC